VSIWSHPPPKARGPCCPLVPSLFFPFLQPPAPTERMFSIVREGSGAFALALFRADPPQPGLPFVGGGLSGPLSLLFLGCPYVSRER